MSSSVLQDSARRLLEQKAGFAPAKPAPTKGARPGEKSVGRPASAQAAAGVALEESDYASRLYWPAVTLTSSDGLFTIETEPIKQISLEGEGVFTFKEPV